MSRRSITIILTLLPLLMAAWSAAGEETVVHLGFKDSAMVNDTTVYLGDIATIDGPAAIAQRLSRTPVGEAAPAGYSRFVNTSELVTYRLASAFPHTRFLSDASKRISVRTDSKDFTVAQFENKITSFLQEQVKGLPGSYSFELLNRDRGWKTLNCPSDATIEGEMKNSGVGKFNVNLTVKQGARTLTIPVLCRSSLTCATVTAKVPIARGEALSSSNCETIIRKITSAAQVPFTSMENIAGMRSRRTISAGTVITAQFTEKIPAVIKGDPVCITVRQGAVSVSLSGVSRETGGVGDRVWIENTLTHKLIQARISGTGKAEVNSQGATL